MLNDLQASYGERGFRVLAISDPDDELRALEEARDARGTSRRTA